MTKDLTFHINNKVYTIWRWGVWKRELCKYLELIKRMIQNHFFGIFKAKSRV